MRGRRCCTHGGDGRPPTPAAPRRQAARTRGRAGCSGPFTARRAGSSAGQEDGRRRPRLLTSEVTARKGGRSPDGTPPATWDDGWGRRWQMALYVAFSKRTDPLTLGQVQCQEVNYLPRALTCVCRWQGERRSGQRAGEGPRDPMSGHVQAEANPHEAKSSQREIAGLFCLETREWQRPPLPCPPGAPTRIRRVRRGHAPRLPAARDGRGAFVTRHQAPRPSVWRFRALHCGFWGCDRTACNSVWGSEIFRLPG